ncbi:MAG TPA: class A beta-lactamase-related serine hydrolase [Candidatus Aminicenantes bacterium]|nr:class A beta-lactamase-related serine hydrolase [Candidatus Aminicenantes bacterium]
MTAMARPVKRKRAKDPSPASGTSVKPSKRRRRPSRPRSRLTRSADIALVALALVAVGLFAATKIIGGRSGPAEVAGPAQANGAAARQETIGPEGAFADLEAGPAEFDGEDGGEPLSGPAMVSDPYATRPFAPVDDARLAALLDPEIERSLAVGRIPSMAVVCVSGDRIVWTRSAGLANIRVKTPAACDTVYLIASTFKTMSATALLQLMDQGKFGLDDRVNDHLTDLEIKGETKRYPVTFRHLLTHTSGLPTDFGRHAVWEDEGPPALADYLRGRLQLWRRPGTRVMYSNIAFTLVAHLVEKLSGTPFKEYMRRNVFAPAEMRDTAFEPRADMAERLAIPYMPVRRRAGVYRPVDWVKADAWPAGVVYGTAVDMARWLMTSVNGGIYKGRRLVSESAFREMTRRQYDRFAGPINGGWLNETSGYGLAWWVSTLDGETIIAHSGSVNGYTAFMAGSVDKRTGVVIMTNGNKAHRWLYALALKALAAL